jgi:hypothetical protein
MTPEISDDDPTLPDLFTSPQVNIANASRLPHSPATPSALRNMERSPCRLGSTSKRTAVRPVTPSSPAQPTIMIATPRPRLTRTTPSSIGSTSVAPAPSPPASNLLAVPSSMTTQPQTNGSAMIQDNTGATKIGKFIDTDLEQITSSLEASTIGEGAGISGSSQLATETPWSVTIFAQLAARAKTSPLSKRALPIPLPSVRSQLVLPPGGSAFGSQHTSSSRVDGGLFGPQPTPSLRPNRGLFGGTPSAAISSPPRVHQHLLSCANSTGGLLTGSRPATVSSPGTPEPVAETSCRSGPSGSLLFTSARGVQPNPLGVRGEVVASKHPISSPDPRDTSHPDLVNDSPSGGKVQSKSSFGDRLAVQSYRQGESRSRSATRSGSETAHDTEEDRADSAAQSSDDNEQQASNSGNENEDNTSSSEDDRISYVHSDSSDYESESESPFDDDVLDQACLIGMGSLSGYELARAPYIRPIFMTRGLQGQIAMLQDVIGRGYMEGDRYFLEGKDILDKVLESLNFSRSDKITRSDFCEGRVPSISPRVIFKSREARFRCFRQALSMRSVEICSEQILKADSFDLAEEEWAAWKDSASKWGRTHGGLEQIDRY